jgi:putative tryptophan/tyrosine transport system substrate-binding protein
MRRREFITLLCCAATAWPRSSNGQAPSKTRPLIGWVSGGGRTASWTFVEAFLEGMRDFGYVEGKQFDFTARFADGYVERLPLLADELVRLNPSAILAPGSGPAVAARKATATIPIVAPALGDAVHLGLIASEERPGGNVTGISPYVPGLPAKQLEFAREILPGAGSIGVLANLVDPKAPPQLQELRDAGQKMGIMVVAAEADTPGDLDNAIQSLVSQRIDVIIVLQTSMLLSERKKIAALIAAARVPTIYGYRQHVESGGLISYGVDLRACFTRAAYFVDKILHGVPPANLPVEFPTKLEMVINLPVVKALGLTIPNSVLVRADTLIE